MIKSYFIAALRNFRRNKLHTTINVLGLSLGLTASLLALMFVLDEQSFDKFHTKADRLYRLNKIRTESDGSTNLNAESSGLYGPGMLDELPEIENYVRYQPWYDEIVMSRDDRHIELGEMDAIFVDHSFFEVFNFELMRGDPKTVLTRPSTIVLTKSLAAVLFGEEDPIGKTVIGLGNLDYEVTGIVADPPRNSHIQFRALISFATTVPQLGPLNYEWMNNWHTQTLTTYVLLKPGSSPEAVHDKLLDFTKRHIPHRVDAYEYYLQPFSDLYLSSYDVKYHRMAKIGNQQYLYIFSIVAGILLFIACINYVNINTSRSTRRSREVGMRKSLGATYKQLIGQFLGESLLLTIFSAFVSIILLYMAVPYFNELAGKTIDIDLIYDPRIILGLIALVVVVALISGLYPAFVLSSFRPSEVLKSSAKSKISGNLPRHILITFQFVISIIMIAGALLVYKQIHYILSKDLGFDKEHVLVLNLTNDIQEKGDTFQKEIAQHPSVVSTSRCRTALGSGSYSSFIVPEGFPPNQTEVRMFPVDGNFMETYDLKIAQGRFFDINMASDSGALIINESLARLLHWDHPTEKTIKFEEGGEAYPIIGVLTDFNFFALYQEVDPMVMWISSRNQSNLSIRFTGDPTDLVAHAEETWKQFDTRYPFHYYFVDQQFAQLYQADTKLFKTVLTFAGVSIFIACLGLYGLVSFTIEQRTKEFGIRKVLGASVSSLNFMVNRKFIVMVILASLIAVPVVIKLVNVWLDKFAFKTTVDPAILIASVVITIVITMAAVSIQAVRAAMLNPVDSLKHE